MSIQRKEFHLAYFPVFIQEPTKREVTTQTESAVLCAVKTPPKPTIDFFQYRTKGKPKYAPLKYRCIPAGHKTDPEDELLIPYNADITNRRW